MNKGLLLKVLKDEWTPWEVETIGTSVLNESFSDLLVLGTRQNPMQICNGLRNEREAIDLDGIAGMHIEHMMAQRMFPNGRSFINDGR